MKLWTLVILTTNWPLTDFFHWVKNCDIWGLWFSFQERHIKCAVLFVHVLVWTLSEFPVGIKALQPVNAAGEVCLSFDTEKRHKHKTPRLLQGPVQLSCAPNLCNPLSSRRSARMTEPILFTTTRQWHGRSLASRPKINTPALWEKRERAWDRESWWL